MSDDDFIYFFGMSREDAQNKLSQSKSESELWFAEFDKRFNNKEQEMTRKERLQYLAWVSKRKKHFGIT